MEKEKYVGYKILLKPSKSLIKEFNRYFGMRNFVYNWGIDQIENHYVRYKQGLESRSKKSWKTYSIELNNLKNNTLEYKWLTEYDSTSVKYTLKDVEEAYKMFWNGINKRPRYHRKKFHHQSFYTRPDKIKIESNRIKLCKIDEWIYVQGTIPKEILGYGDPSKQPYSIYTHKKYYSSRIVFDGTNYYLSISLVYDKESGIVPASCRKYIQNDVWRYKQEKSIKVIGIDVGCKEDNWITCSNGYVQKRRSQKKEDKRIAGYQKKYQRQLNAQKKKEKQTGVRIKHMSKSMEKTLNKINDIQKTITNRKKNDIRELTNKLLDECPKAIVFEDFKINEWMIKDRSKPSFVRHLINKQINDSILYEARLMMTRKLSANGVIVIYAHNEFPSTQLCNCCNYRQKLNIHQRQYVCPICGTHINRDLNASLNLQYYGEESLGISNHGYSELGYLNDNFIKNKNIDIA